MNTELIFSLNKLPQDVHHQILTTPKFYKWFSEYPSKLLGIDSNAKTVKGLGLDISTAILYLSPYLKSGMNVCPMAHIANCHGPCLNEAGRGAMSTVQMSRLRKTLYWQQFPELFLEQIIREVLTHAKKCERLGLVPAVRLNGTSDIKWENHISSFMVTSAKAFGVKWYDYTKIANRIVPSEYDLTFSYSGEPLYRQYVERAIANKMRIAVVFRDKESFSDWRSFKNVKDLYNKRDAVLGSLSIINGDDHDARFLEPHNSVVALYAKGKAKHDTSYFVVDTLLTTYHA